MKSKKIILRIFITLVVGFITYYFCLPAINLHSFGFYIFILFLIFVYKLSNVIRTHESIFKTFKTGEKKKIILRESYVYMSIFIVFILIFVSNFIFSPLFMSKKYANRIVIDETSSFTEDIKEVNYNALPLLDKESSSKLGDRVMGQMSELVSQFEVSSLYTQINYNSDIIRVTPLEYASFIKWITNRSDGVKGYITVNSVSIASELKNLEDAIIYMPSSYFN